MRVHVHLAAAITFFACHPCFCQSLSESDFKADFLKLQQSIDSVVARKGHAKRVEKLKEEWEGFTAHYYDRLNVWVKEDNREIWAFDFSDTSFVTQRGLRVGDSVKKLEKSYGERKWTEKEFSRVGPYDHLFRDYAEVTIYDFWLEIDDADDGDVWYMVFYIKDEKIVRVLCYVGVYE